MKRFGYKALSLCLACVMLLSLAACGGSSSGSIDSAAKSAIEDAAKKLNSTYTNYIVSNTIEYSDMSSEFIEVVKGSDIYTEYSIAEDGSIGSVAYGSADSIQYALTDWTHDGQYYSFDYAEDGSYIYKFPANFAKKYNNDREMLWANRILAGATEVSVLDDMQLTLNGSVETFSAYKVRVKSDTVKAILSAGGQGVYKSIKDEEKAGSNISKLCDFYLEATALESTYSDGIVTFAVDQDGILRFMSLEVGGLGQTMYYTKAVVDVRNQNARDLPDFSQAIPLVSTMTEMADFVAQYPDYDSALKALNEKANAGDFDINAGINSSDLDEAGIDTSFDGETPEGNTGGSSSEEPAQ